MTPAGVIQVRADICHDCPAPCAWQHDAAAHSTTCAACPIRKWGQWGNCASTPAIPPPPPSGMRGLGDLVALIAEPIARAINLDKSKCKCGQRQERLNAAVPFKRRGGEPPSPPPTL